MLEQANSEINFCTNCSNYHGLFINIINRHSLTVWSSSFRIWCMEWTGTSTLKLGTNTLKNTYLLVQYGYGHGYGMDWDLNLETGHELSHELTSCHDPNSWSTNGNGSHIYLLWHHWHLASSFCIVYDIISKFFMNWNLELNTYY